MRKTLEHANLAIVATTVVVITLIGLFVAARSGSHVVDDGERFVYGAAGIDDNGDGLIDSECVTRIGNADWYHACTYDPTTGVRYWFSRDQWGRAWFTCDDGDTWATLAVPIEEDQVYCFAGVADGS